MKHRTLERIRDLLDLRTDCVKLHLVNDAVGIDEIFHECDDILDDACKMLEV